MVLELIGALKSVLSANDELGLPTTFKGPKAVLFDLMDLDEISCQTLAWGILAHVTRLICRI